MRKILLVFIINLSFLFLAQAQQTVTGSVTDAETEEPLIGVSILVQGTNSGATTNVDGEYQVEVPDADAVLEFTFVGFRTVTEEVNGRSEINVEMFEDLQELDDVVVVGFGTQSRRNIIGSVSSINNETLTESFSTTIDKALQGKTAGVQVTSTSGVLGAPVSVRVRGTSSINAESQPLYVVDGVPVVSNELGGNFGVGGEGGVNPLINLNSNDIESVEVLKDASAASVYGSRGANGVVLITTKSGVEGQSELNINMSTGFSNPTKEYDLLSGPEYIEMYNYAYGASLDPDNFADTDWADIVTRTGSVQNYGANVSGGNEQTQYYISGSYSIEEGYARPNQLEKFNALAKVNHKFNDRLNVSLSVNPSRSDNNRIPTSNQVSAPYTFAALEAPVISQFLPNGEPNDGISPDDPGNAFAGFNGTPYSNILGNNITSVTNQVNSNGSLTYRFPQNLEFNTTLAVQYLQNRESARYATYTTDGYPDGFGSAANDEFLNYSWNNTLTYQNEWDEHAVTATVGATFEKTDQTFFNVSGNTFASNDLPTLNSAAEITGGGSFIDSYGFQNNLARLTYGYDDKYLLTLTGSYNGSSRFPDDNRYGFFPAAAIGWVVSDESFMDDIDPISFLKLRTSYGITGNAGIGNFAYLGLLGAGGNYADEPGLALSQLPNEDLGWEQSKQFDVGLEYGLFDGTINGSIAYYNKVNTDLLLAVPVSNTNGFTSFTRNTGEMMNEGFEFDINANIINEPDLAWTVSANISTLRNEVLSLPAGEFSQGENLVREGEPIGSFYVREYLGVDSENGDALFADEDGNPTSNYNAAPRKILSNPHPEFFGGFGTNVAYKGIDANINFQYSYGNEVYWADGEFMATNLSSVWNQQTSQLDYWTPDNTDASVPEPRNPGVAGLNGSQSSSRYLQDASYLRLKSLEVGYTMPERLVNEYDVRVFAQGTNLLTFTDYEGLDPEVTPSSGANVTQGNVFFQLPQPRTLLFGIQLGL
ncbi:MAG: TonB-dependent receptor [Gracilimonas sp.]